MTKNEEKVLPYTLESLTRFRQVFVVDSGSTDQTKSIAKANGAQIVNFAWNGRYPKKKEWCLGNLPFSEDWVLYLDADEFVTKGLELELLDLFSGHPEHMAYDVELDYFFLGRKLKHGHRVTKRVLIRRDAISWPHPDDLGVKNMWEVEGHYQPSIKGTVGRLIQPLEHNDRDPLYDYFARHNRYSDWEAHLASVPSAADIVRGARSTRGQRYAGLRYKPLAFFCYSYLLRRGFLDGQPGFHYAIAHAFYFWQIGIKIREAQDEGTISAVRSVHSGSSQVPD